MAISKTGLAFAAALLGLGLLIGQASATPASRLSVAASQSTGNLHSVGWVCDAYRCWYAPDYYTYYGYYAPSYYYGSYPYAYVAPGGYW
jgi:hypothetical protein